MQDGMTYAEILQRVADLLATSQVYAEWPAGDVAHQTRAEAQTIVRHVTQMSQLALVQSLCEAAPADEQAQIIRIAEARRAGQPLAYLIGYTHFYGRVFQTRPGCLIPRPDTETLLHVAREWVSRHAPDADVADIGTGSGCLAVTLKLECPNTYVTAVDVSPDALSIARDNAATNQADIQFVLADGFEWLAQIQAADRQPRVIMSNPPYIPSRDVDTLELSVQAYEPHLALDGGADGLDFYRRFAIAGPEVLQPEGPAALFFEVGADQAIQVRRLFETDRWAGFTVATHADLRGILRVVAVTRSA